MACTVLVLKLLQHANLKQGGGIINFIRVYLSRLDSVF